MYTIKTSKTIKTGGSPPSSPSSPSPSSPLPPAFPHHPQGFKLVASLFFEMAFEINSCPRPLFYPSYLLSYLS
jgi:hypothetical protein